MEMANWQFWSAIFWLVGSAWQATSSLIQMRKSTAKSIHSTASTARVQVVDALQAREMESTKFAAENDISPDMAGTDYTDIFTLSEDLGSRLREQRAALIRSYRSAFFGWTVIFVAATMGAIASWPM